MHWDGIEWNLVNDLITLTVVGLFGDSAANLYALNPAGVITRWDGTEWTILGGGG